MLVLQAEAPVPDSDLKYLIKNKSKIRLLKDDESWLKVEILDDYEVYDVLEDYFVSKISQEECAYLQQQDLNDGKWTMLIDRSRKESCEAILSILREIAVEV